MLKNIRSYFYNFKKYQRPLEKYVFPLVLLLYPLIGVTAGLDITDTTYSMANYEFIGGLNPMWLLSTFLGNITGAIIMHLPGAGTMLGFGIYCSFIISMIALVSYCMLQKYMPGWMIFIGTFMAESLCWCPRVIMYNYLTYLFFTLGALLLARGLFFWEKQNIYLFFAGIFLGLNVMVRFPNITETALILVLWFYGAITGDDFLDVLKKTGICILGFVTGVIVVYVIISLMYGPGAYFEMIGSLFGMTKGASDYTTSGMISAIIDAYWGTVKDMLILMPCIGAGIVMFLIRSDKYVWIKKLIYILGLLIIIKFYFAKGVFTGNYYYYDSIFKVAMMFIIISLILGIIGSTGFLNGNRQEQTLSFLMVMIILITPLGSNNYTYPVINNLFVVAPVSLWIMRRLMQRLGEKQLHFTWQSTITMVIAVLLVQGAIFHVKFSFVDGADGQVRDQVVQAVPKVDHMITTSYNARTVEELGKYLSDNGLTGTRALLFGGIPGLSYIFDLKPAIDTVWPDLDSYSIETFDEKLIELSTSDDPYPLIIIGKDMQEYANISMKYDILLDYINNHDYNIDFESERFTVYVADKE